MIEFHSPTSHSVQKTVVIKMLEIPTGQNCPNHKKPYQIPVLFLLIKSNKSVVHNAIETKIDIL